MPIFRDELEYATSDSFRGATGPVMPPPSLRPRRLSEASIRTEFCDGPVLDEPLRPSTPRHAEDVTTSDRTEFIEMLKRGASPTWIPNRHLESFMQQSHAEDLAVTPPSESHALFPLPSVQITPEKEKRRESLSDHLRDGLSIERPRSALHSGDFTTDETEPEDRQGQVSREQQVESHAAPDGWFATSPPRDFVPFAFTSNDYPPEDLSRSYRSGPSSLSSQSSFWYQPPTTPLVQSETSDELVSSLPDGDMPCPRGRHAASRRHTLYASHGSPPPSSSSPSSPLPPMGISRRRDGIFPYQAHQPRRSLPGTPNPLQHQQYGTFSQMPALMRARRLSIGSDFSPAPLHHASMVGSYEESILRGRMSTTPSKPIEFVAQIGVLGKGNCKPSLQCPPHVTLPFPAVYYSYDNPFHGTWRVTNDGPSPYVGQIDLENGLPNPDEESRARRKNQTRITDMRKPRLEQDTAMADPESCRTSRLRRRGSGSPKAPPGGSYRIPEQGQIQIIVKNQNKSAVKLFLVPYDLVGMSPGTKTFIRQRSYSVGPDTDTDTAQQPSSSVLRYLVHLHICSPSRDRFYLYKSVRIVFANRVPDGKEKLRNETTWPDPRFSPYKPMRLMNPPAGSSSSGPAAMLVAEKALRRRSLGVSLPLHGEMLEPPLFSEKGGHGFTIRGASEADDGGTEGSSSGATEGLLSQRLRGLGMKPRPPSPGESM